MILSLEKTQCWDCWDKSWQWDSSYMELYWTDELSVGW